VMRRIVIRELIAYSERVALNLRTENRSGFVRLVLLELRVLVSTVYYCTAPFPYTLPVTPRVQVRLYFVVNGVVVSSTGL
jgi:hypothetical protein